MTPDEQETPDDQEDGQFKILKRQYDDSMAGKPFNKELDLHWAGLAL
jgi:hypothetical protein